MPTTPRSISVEEIGVQFWAPLCSMTRSRRFLQTANKMSFRVWRLIRSDRVPQSAPNHCTQSWYRVGKGSRNHYSGNHGDALTVFPCSGYALDKLVEGVSMKRRGVRTMLGGWLLTAAMGCPRIHAQVNEPEPPPEPNVGDVAPDFKLQSFD